jgi:hypothetical protein
MGTTVSTEEFWPGVVVHTNIPNFLKGGDSITASGQPGQNISNALFQRTSCVRWCVSAIPAMQEG